MVDKKQEIQELKEEIREIKASLPAHSVQAAALLRLEELEDLLAVALDVAEHRRKRDGEVAEAKNRLRHR